LATDISEHLNNICIAQNIALQNPCIINRGKLM